MSALSVRAQEPLARHLAWRTGGPCEAWVVAHDEEGVREVLDDCRAADWPVHVLGAGTRTVAREGPLEGVALRLGTGFGSIRFIEPDLWIAGGATPVPALLAAAGARGFAGPPEAYVVPGSFGASVLHEPWELVSARVARPGRTAELDASKLGGRTKGVVLEATVRLESVGVGPAEARLRKALAGDLAPPSSWVEGRRVRAELRRASLERVRLREVAIPEEAPEMVVNLGGGTARDMQLLHQSALERLKRTRGVALASRVKWIGERRDA